VLVIGEERPVDAVPVEQDPRVARVLAKDDIGCAELGEDAKRDVFEIPDRRGADGERQASPP
jgi:hypothetical protein